MKKILAFCLISSICMGQIEDNKKFETVFEKSDGKETATYYETIGFYTKLAEKFPQIQIKSIGMTDAGLPLHYVILNNERIFDFDAIRKSNKRILLINNGIHPGESDGIDATMMLFRDIVQKKIPFPKETVLVTIPIYNVGGSLNRNATSRTNQNGPREYGFRGNARNYDLNRDFIKCDTKNARAFAELYHLIQPDVFIDNHVSNGADYQYTLTHLFTQHNKLGGSLGDYLQNEMMPKLEEKLKEKDWDITPYVNVFNETPDKGFSQFMDYPRYSTGYTALWNTLGMMVETHMLKPYKQRVEGTYALMQCLIEIMEKDSDKIATLRKEAFTQFQNKKIYVLDWELDSSKVTSLNFKGFEGKMIESELTGAMRLKFDQSKPFIKEINYYNHFKPRLEVSVPDGYIIPQSWWNIINLLKINKVEMKQFDTDTTLTVETYRIDSYETRNSAYEGHYQHYNTSIIATATKMNFKKGDVYIPTKQPAIRYLLETLEPQAPDSFFNWNFFDSILQQKEGFSPYVWEDIAKQLLEENEQLKQEFESKKQSDKAFAENWYAQLDWLHKKSEHYEKSHLQYPVYRVLAD